jgi:hypothetical protein
MTRRSWIVVLVVTALGCGGKGSGATCPTGSTLTYDNFGRPFFARYCDACHGTSGRTQPSLGTLAQIRAQSASIDQASAAGPDGVNTTMPESDPRPTEAERRQLGEWLACGAR